jgi:hypothetical protein
VQALEISHQPNAEEAGEITVSSLKINTVC